MAKSRSAAHSSPVSPPGMGSADPDVAPAAPPTGAAEHWEVGRAARKAVPRSALGQWTAPADRADPVATLQAQDADRVADLVPLRYERMSASAHSSSCPILLRTRGSLPDLVGDV